MRIGPALTSLVPALATLLHVGAAQTLANRLFPHLLVPVHDKYPDQAYGTQYFGEVGTYPNGDEAGHMVDTLILFDMPADFKSQSYHHCSIAFDLNTVRDNWNLAYTGPPDAHYSFLVFQLQTLIKVTDSWNTPRTFIDKPVATVTVTPTGQVTVVSEKLPCGGGPWDTANFIMIPADYRAKLWWYELMEPLNGITYEMYQ